MDLIVTDQILKKPGPVSNKDFRVKTHMGMMHAEMIVESCIVKFLKPFDAAYFQ